MPRRKFAEIQTAREDPKIWKIIPFAKRDASPFLVVSLLPKFN